MSRKLRIDLVTEDPSNREFAVYLVEDGPWSNDSLTARLEQIRDRIHDAVEAVIDGHVATMFPETRGRQVRIQLDCHGCDAPLRLIDDLVASINSNLASDARPGSWLSASSHVSTLRIVTRQEMGRGTSL